MAATRFSTPIHGTRSLTDRFIWPGTITLALAAIAACGGSSTDDTDSPTTSAGSGGALGHSGSASTTAGHNTGTSGSSSSSAGNSSGGKQASGGQAAVGGSSPYPELVCNCEGPGNDRKWKCKQPAEPPENMCPPTAPKDVAACQTADPPAPACHYTEPAVDCKCTDDKWVCSEAI